MNYVDGFVIPIEKEKIEEYKQIAEESGKVWKEYGALDYRECVIDETDEKHSASFKKNVGISENESVIFAWITYESKAERDRINTAVMEDERMDEIKKRMDKLQPFEHWKMAFSGFNRIV